MKRRGVVAGLLLCMVVGSVRQVGAADKITLWPLLRYDSTGGKTDLEVLWPAFDMEKSPQENMWRLLFTASQHKVSDGKTTWDLLWPLFRVQYDQAGNRHSRFFPLCFGHDSESRYLVLFPELWVWGGNKGRHLIVLLPWFRSWQGEDSYTNALTPVIWGRTHNERYGFVLPIAYWSYRPGEYRYSAFFFPFFQNTDRPTKSTTGLLPWWVTRKGDEQFANLFPVLWTRSGKEFKSFVVLPVFYKIGESKVLFPLYWDVGETLLAIPLYGKGKFREIKWETILPPTYVHWTKGDYREHDALWPLAQWGTDGKNRQVFAVRPIFDYMRKEDYVQRSILLRLGAYGRGGGRKLDRFFPLFNYDRKADRRDLALLWPLYGEEKRENGMDRRLMSFFLTGLGEVLSPADSWHALNLAWWGKTQGKEQGIGVTQTHGLYPLYSFEKRNEKHWRYQSEPGGKTPSRSESVEAWTRFRVFDLLTPLERIPVGIPGLFYKKGPADVSHCPILSWVLPLFQVSRSSSGERRWEMPLDLFHWEKGAEPDKRWRFTFGTPFLFTNSWGENWHDLHVASFFWDITGQPHSDMLHSQGLWPLYTFKRRARGALNLSFLDPLWFWGEATGEEEHVSGLMKILDYRRQKNGDSRFMFLWRAYRRDVRGNATSWEAFPFMGWEKSPERTSFSFFWRLFAYEKSDGRRSLWLFFLPRIGLGGSEK